VIADVANLTTLGTSLSALASVFAMTKFLEIKAAQRVGYVC